MNQCEVCGNRGVVYRGRVEGGRAIWNEPHEVPDVVQCPLCFLDKLIGAR